MVEKFTRVVTHEWRMLVSDRTPWVVVLLLAASVGYGVFNGAQWARFQRAAIQKGLDEQARRYSDLKRQVVEIQSGRQQAPFADPRMPDMAGGRLAWTYAAMPPLTLSSLSIGQSDVLPYYFRVSTASKESVFTTSELENPQRLLLGRFDLSFVIIYLFPLFIIALSYNLLSAEREQGTLALLLSQPVGLKTIIAGKVVVRGLLVVVPVMAVSVVALAATGVPLTAGDQLVRLLVWAGIVAAYGAFWFGAVLTVTSLGRSSATNVLALAGLWLLLVVILPSTLGMVVSMIYPMPSRVEMIGAMRAASNDASARGDALLAGSYGDHPEFAAGPDTPNDLGDVAITRLMIDEEIEHNVRPVVDQSDIQLAHQQRLIDRFRLLSPAIVAQDALNDVAGTGGARYRRFVALVEDYHQRWSALFASMIGRKQRVTPAMYDVLPQFSYREEPFEDVMVRTWPEVAVLLASGLVLAAFGVGRLRKYPITGETGVAVLPHRIASPLILLAATVSLSAQSSPPADANVTRATLENGLRVVIIRDALAPVVTTEQNYLVGANETPPGFPGMAHAQEHMIFRGCAGLSADQIAAIYAQLGGNDNADTQQNITQYLATVPAADLEVALRVDAACMQDAVDADAEWAQEKGAIEQEVARDLSEPTYKFITRLNEDMFAGSPYAHDALGTHDSFEATTGAMLRQFYKDWYAPNNAILVIVGDVNPQRLLATIRDLYGSIARRPLPARPDVSLAAVKPETFSLASDLPYVLGVIAYRLPGTDSTEFAAARILADVLNSHRGNLYALVPQGTALEAEFEFLESYPKASVGISLAALPVGGDVTSVVGAMRAILSDYAKNGVPAELVEAAKHKAVAAAEFERNSIPGLAAAWSDALAARGRTSPDEDVAAIRQVTVDAVNRVAKQYLTDDNSITATLVPSASGEPSESKGFGGSEQLTSAPTKPVELPEWAASRLASPRIPDVRASWSDTTLPNKLRLIVKTDRTSPTVTVVGRIHHEPTMETPSGKEGVADMLGDLFSYGTTTQDRLAFEKALDDIAANETAGFDFSLGVLKADFERGVELLAEHELHPDLPAEAFEIVKHRAGEYVAGQLKSPGYRAGRAVSTGLLPARDPALRETTPETVGSVTLDDVKAYYAKTFRPDLTTMVVIGDVTEKEARAAVERAFGGWRATGPAPAITLPRVPANKASAAHVPDPSQIQDSVTLAQQVGITRFDADYYALQLGEHVLGGGFYATRFYHDLRQVSGLVYGVDDSLSADRTRTTYRISYGCDPQNVSKARALIERDLRTMQTDLVTPAELGQARALLVRQIWLRESSEDAVAGTLLARAQIGLPLDESVRGSKRYLAITAEEIRAAFKKWIRPDAFVQVVQGPLPR